MEKMIGNGKRPLSLKDRVDDYTLGLEHKKERRKNRFELIDNAFSAFGI